MLNPKPKPQTLNPKPSWGFAKIGDPNFDPQILEFPYNRDPKTVP